MRARNIKPGFFKNELLGVMDPMTHLTFAGLWLLADKNGRLEDRPQKIKGELFPFRECDIERHLGELERANFIVRYKSGNFGYISVINFKKHQSPHHTEKPQGYPPPPSETVIITTELPVTVKSPVHNGYVTVSSPLDNGEITVRQRSESLIPDSLNPESPPNPLKGERTCGLPRKGRPPEPTGFDDFWNAYPKKRGKDAARKAWRKAKPPLDAVLKALEWQTASADWTKDNGQFIPHPSTYLNQGRWQDEPEDITPTEDPLLEWNRTHAAD